MGIDEHCWRYVLPEPERIYHKLICFPSSRRRILNHWIVVQLFPALIDRRLFWGLTGLVEIVGIKEEISKSVVTVKKCSVHHLDEGLW